MHRRHYFRRSMCSSARLLACTAVIILAFFITPSRQQNLDDICGGRVFALPRHIRIACDDYLSRTLSVGNTDSQPSPGSDGTGLTDNHGQRRPMTDPPRYGKRRAPPMQSMFTATKRRLNSSVSFNTDKDFLLTRQTSLKISAKKMILAAFARAVAEQLQETTKTQIARAVAERLQGTTKTQSAIGMTTLK